jgi:hypothetical protein
MATQIVDAQRIEDFQTAILRLVQEHDTVQVSNEYLPRLLRMAADQRITINSTPSKKNYTDVSAFPRIG